MRDERLGLDALPAWRGLVDELGCGFVGRRERNERVRYALEGAVLGWVVDGMRERDALGRAVLGRAVLGHAALARAALECAGRQWLGGGPVARRAGMRL